MRVPRKEVYKAIDTERDYQDLIWRLADDPSFVNELTIGEFVLLVEEYAAKARNVWTNQPKPELETLEFMRKIAGITVNCMEQHGAPKRLKTGKSKQ